MRTSLGIAGLLALVWACSDFSSAAPDETSDDAGADAVSSSPDAAAGDGASPLGRCTAPLTEGWSTPERLTSLVGPNGERTFVDPFVTADGLTLLVVNGSGADLRVYRATRKARGDAWPTLAELRGFANPTYLSPYPSSANPDAEVIVAAEYQNGDMFELLPGDGGTWSAEYIPPLQRPDQDHAPTITADGLMLVYQEVNANAGNPFHVLFSATRAAPTPASPWSGSKGLAAPPFDGGPGDVDWHHPALTPSGLGLFYAVSATKDVVYFASRKTRQDEFFTATQAGVPVPSLQAPGYTTRVRSVTADGCELYLTSDREDGVLDSYVARRAP